MFQLLALCTLLLSVPASAQELHARMSPAIVGGSVAAAAGMTAFVETFDGASDCDGAGARTEANCDNTTWVTFGNWSGATTFTGTTDTDPDPGTNYLSLVDATPTNDYTGAYAPFTAGSPRYVFFKIRMTTGAGLTSADIYSIGSLRDSSGNRLCSVVLYHNGTDTVFSAYAGAIGSGTKADSTVTWAINVTYAVWLEYTKNTSCVLYVVGASTTKPGSASASNTDTVPNTDAARIYAEGYAGTGTHDTLPIKIDRIKVKDSAWGNDGG